jgi:glycosyltransferase involved in cell wall biosynthesis
MHVSYVHTPMRYLWDETGSYFQFGTARRSRRVALALVAPYLRRFDLQSAKAVDYFIANSHNVRDRIRRIYQAEAAVIHPPVDTDYFRPAPQQSTGDYYLCVSSLEPYKRIDLAIEAFRRLDRRLIIVGSGSQERPLRRLAAQTPASIEFVGRVSDERLRRLYQNCRAVVFPGVEDFGIVPVEAQACGKPVICCGQGGAVESVVDGETGVHFLPQQAEALMAAIEKAETTAWDAQHVRENSLRFSAARFRDRMEAFMLAHLGLSLHSLTSPDAHRNPVRLL